MAPKRDFLVRVSLLSAAGVFGVGIIIILIALFVTKTFKPAQDSLANHIPAEDTVFFLRTRDKAQLHHISTAVARMVGMGSAPAIATKADDSPALYEFAIVATNSGKTLSWVSEVQLDAQEDAPAPPPTIAMSDELIAQVVRDTTKNKRATLSRQSAYVPLQSEFNNTSWLLKTEAITSVSSDKASILLSSLVKQFSWCAMVTSENYGQFWLMDPDLRKLPDQTAIFPEELDYVTRHPLLLIHINRSDAIAELLAGAFSTHKPLSAGIAGILTAQIQQALGSHVTTDEITPFFRSPVSLEIGTSESGSYLFALRASGSEADQTQLTETMKLDAAKGIIRHVEFSDNKRSDVMPSPATQSPSAIGKWHIQYLEDTDLRGPLTVAKAGNEYVLGSSGSLVEAMIHDHWKGSISYRPSATPIAAGLLDTGFVKAFVQARLPFLFDPSHPDTLLGFLLEPIVRLPSFLWSVESAEGSIILRWSTRL